MDTKRSIKLRILFDSPFWVGIFERNSEDGYSVAKHVFGAEPSEPELYNFLIANTNELKFTTPDGDEKPVIRKKNPKRIIREIRKEVSKPKPITKAHAAIKKEQETNKKITKTNSSKIKRENALRKFQLKQQKKKEKLKGH